jgi:hypothetical protein
MSFGQKYVPFWNFFTASHARGSVALPDPKIVPKKNKKFQRSTTNKARIYLTRFYLCPDFIRDLFVPFVAAF